MSCGTCAAETSKAVAQRIGAPVATGAVERADASGVSVVAAYWEGLRRTTETGTCPRCSASGLDVREKRYRGRVWRYVLHCGSLQWCEWPGPGRLGK